MPLSLSEIKAVESWADGHKFTIDQESIEKLGRYRDLIVTWSGRMNLVSRSDIPHILTNHILDSLGPVAMIPSGSRVIDIGSGAGLPGIPLAIARDDITVSLLESIHKKALFLRTAQGELGLEKLAVLEERLEMTERDRSFDIATVRALPRLENLIDKVQALIRPGGMIIYYEKRGIYRGIHV
jgi:16S rRNA (guanine527-N7)-methyltransferase